MFKKLTYLTISLSLVVSLVIPYIQARAAVPVHIVGFEANTDFGINLGKSLFDLYQTLQKQQQDFLTSFELQKIEKAREDVNKLMYEVRQELQDQGEILEMTDPATGAKYTIMKEGRMITNVDNFLYEEPLQKAREFIYCYFGDWKFFPFGNASESECRGPDPDKPYPDDKCDSNKKREELEDRIIMRLLRKTQPFLMSPPESWYTKKACSLIAPNLMSYTSGDSASLDFYSDLSQSLEGINAEGKNWTWTQFLKSGTYANSYDATYARVSNLARQIVEDYQKMRMAEYVAGQGIRPEKYWTNVPVDNTGLVLPYETEYVLSPAAVLLQKMQSATQAEFDLAQKAYMNLPVGTPEDTLEKYNLVSNNTPDCAAVMALADAWPPPRPDWLQELVDKCQERQIIDVTGEGYVYLDPWLKPEPPEFGTAVLPSWSPPGSGGSIEMQTLRGGLPAPWEDNYAYTTLPEAYYNKYQEYKFSDTKGEPDELGDIHQLDVYTSYEDKDKFLNQWYKDIMEMYQFSYPTKGGVAWQKRYEGMENFLKEFFAFPGAAGKSWAWFISTFPECKAVPPNPDACYGAIIDFKF